MPAYDGRPSLDVCFAAASNCDSGILVCAARIVRIWLTRLPSGIVTVVCTRFFGLSSAAYARVAFMW